MKVVDHRLDKGSRIPIGSEKLRKKFKLGMRKFIARTVRVGYRRYRKEEGCI